MKINLFSLALAFSALAASSLSCRAATYTVTSLGDTPAPGTLRWAIEQSNANAGSTIAFATTGTILLFSPLPDITRTVTINGATAPGFDGTPVVAVDFSGQPGLSIAAGADGAHVKSLSLVHAGNSAITIRASKVTVDGNYIGLTPEGAVNANLGDGVKIAPSSHGNLIGDLNPVTGFKYFDASNAADFTIQPVTAWQGLRNHGSSTRQFLVCGTTNDDGLLYVGPLAGGGKSYKVKKPDAATTSVYGPDNRKNGGLRLVGSYTRRHDGAVYNHGFVWDGAAGDLPGGGLFRTIDYPGAKYQFTHSTMGDLAVGNADGPGKAGKSPLGPGIAYLYDVAHAAFVANVVFPGSKSNTAYGIWYNGGTSYTICGGYSPTATNNLKNQSLPLAQGRGYLVDYDSKTGKFSHWAPYRYWNGKRGRSFITHFEGISSAEAGVYTLSADSVKRGTSGPNQGSWVSVRRNADGSFGRAQWVDLNFPDEPVGITSSNSVFGNNVVGVVIGPSVFAYQATVKIGFQLSNVISGNKGNGIGIYGSNGNVVAQNYIGADPTGVRAIGNRRNGILVTARASGNLIGGQEAGDNNPTGTENKTTPVFIVPPQGNLISGNKADGVLITGSSSNNTLSGNFIGTDASGNKPLGNGLDGVGIDHSKGNSLIGCTLHQNPFVFYNVVSGNGRDGIRLTNADNATVQANFIGIGANNATLVANAGDGLSVGGSSKNTQVGGVIPLGNVISGNARNGIAVRGTASGFISFNTFGGGFAFGLAAPNGRNGILITSTGGNNTVRTCILSGNAGNGIEIGGDASGVQVTDTACGTNTDIDAALPNQGCGVVLSGTAHGNAIGGFEPSVETRTHFSGNAGYGIAVMDQAHDNAIFNSNVGLGFALTDGLEPTIPNQTGGIFLDSGTSGTTIGGVSAILRNKISTNTGGGLILSSSARNSVLDNAILKNTAFGLFATGPCNGTVVQGNTITGNGNAPADNVDISQASGMSFTP
ncbi:MAG: right-handed parallel beta-helix repeat-containing protein [Terrimicrobiaceae bacterium]|nr:right-handed parallel beta-helix repeat-containing protein [Terrimicrobiaceae bacterium]